MLCNEHRYLCKLVDYAVAQQVDSIPATSRKAGFSWLQMRTKAKHATENTSFVFKNPNIKNFKPAVDHSRGWLVTYSKVVHDLHLKQSSIWSPYIWKN